MVQGHVCVENGNKTGNEKTMAMMEAVQKEG